MTSSKHNPAQGYKRPDRLTTFENTQPKRNGCLKRDRQLVSSGSSSLSAKQPRKDAAVHVSLSSDEIVKQLSEDI